MAADPFYQREALQIVARNQVSRVAEILAELAHANTDIARLRREAENCPRCSALEQRAVALQREIDELCARAESVEAATAAERERIQREVDSALARISAFYTPQTAPQWLYRPKSLLDGASPFQRIAEGRTAEVEALIDQLESGAYV